MRALSLLPCPPLLCVCVCVCVRARALSLSLSPSPWCSYPSLASSLPSLLLPSLLHFLLLLSAHCFTFAYTNSQVEPQVRALRNRECSHMYPNVCVCVLICVLICAQFEPQVRALRNRDLTDPVLWDDACGVSLCVPLYAPLCVPLHVSLHVQRTCSSY